MQTVLLLETAQAGRDAGSSSSTPSARDLLEQICHHELSLAPPRLLERRVFLRDRERHAA